MNIRIDSSGHHALYAGPNCPFCGRLMPENGSCACGVWKRAPLSNPSYLIELTEKGPALAQNLSHYAEQRKAALAEQEQ